MHSRRDWSALSSDLVVEIATRVPLIEDVMAIKGVCSSWRVAVSSNSFKHRSCFPLLMLPGKVPVRILGRGNGNDERDFYSLSKRKVIMRLQLPETRLKRCLGVGFGWILTVASSGDAKLLNPFTRAQIELPNLKSPPCSGPHSLDEFGFITRAVLSVDPSHTSNFVLLAIFSPLGLGFWRVGNECWNKIEPFVPNVAFTDITYYKEKFYAVDMMGKEIWVWDPFGSLNPNKAEVMFEVHIPWEMVFDAYMVESSNGELLLITFHRKDPSCKRKSVRIRRLDVMKRQWKVLAGLGNDAVFVGANASKSMAASAFPDFIEPNRIYFSKQISAPDRKGKHMGIYNIEDGSTEWLVADEPPNRICSALWIAPSF